MADSRRTEPQFLYCMGGPAEKVLCGLVSLQTAVTWVIAIDILLAICYVLESVMLIVLNGLIAGEFVEITVSLVANCVSILALPFGVVGALGFRQNDWEKFHVYFLFKVFETLFICLYAPATSYLYCDDTGPMCEIVTLCAIFFQKLPVDFYFTYIVWSADCLMRSGLLQNLAYARSVELMNMKRTQSK